MFEDSNKVDKALTILAIERTLLTIGEPIYLQVIDILNKEYHCGLTDCYEHPEYLSAILKRLYGDAHTQIIKSINKKLEEFSYKEPIRRFVQVLSR